jgi:hypothetical protein
MRRTNDLDSTDFVLESAQCCDSKDANGDGGWRRRKNFAGTDRGRY